MGKNPKNGISPEVKILLTKNDNLLLSLSKVKLTDENNKFKVEDLAAIYDRLIKIEAENVGAVSNEMYASLGIRMEDLKMKDGKTAKAKAELKPFEARVNEFMKEQVKDGIDIKKAVEKMFKEQKAAEDKTKKI